jgi:hypothetical protein
MLKLLKWLKRNIDGRSVEDSGFIDNIQYNSMSGAQKNVSVGPALEYVGALTNSTKISPGSQLYIFNTGSLDYVTMGQTSTITVGSVPSKDTFPCQPNQYTLYSAADYKYIKGSSTIHLYVLRDESNVRANISDR